MMFSCRMPDDVIPIRADIEVHGGAARAWTLDLPALFRRQNTDPACLSNIASWVIEAPGASLAWHSYLFTVIHLRTLDGLPAPEIVLRGATHQIFLYALNPEEPRWPAMTGECSFQLLRPINFSAQFKESSDADAVSRCERVVRLVCAGALSPEDNLGGWISLFGDNMLKRHYPSTVSASVRLH